MNRIFKTAFHGCDVDVRNLKRYPRYREILEEEIALPRRFGPGTKKGRALRMGVLEFCAELYRATGTKAERAAVRRTPVQTPHEPELRAKLRFLGERIVLCAEQHLTPEILKLAKRWKTGSLHNQHMAAIGLVNCLRAGSASRDMVRARYDQAPGRVWPARYGPALRRGRMKANCFGKAQIVAAFARHVGARAFATVPIRGTRDIYRSADTMLSMVALSSIHKYGLQPGRAFMESLQQKIDFGLEHFRLGAWQHVAIVMQCADGSCLLVDPNFGVVSNVPASEGFQRSLELVTDYSAVLPGITLHASAFLEKADALHQAAEEAKAILISGQELADRVLAKRMGGQALYRLILRRRLLEVLILAREDPLTWQKRAGRSSRRLAAECRLGFIVAALRYFEQQESQANRPSAVELSEIPLMFAATALAHTAVMTHSWERLEPVLARHQPGQHRLHNAMLLLWEKRLPREVRLVAEEVRRLAELLPLKNKDVHVTLERLRQRSPTKTDVFPLGGQEGRPHGQEEAGKAGTDGGRAWRVACARRRILIDHARRGVGR